MPQETLLLTLAAQAASIPFRLFGRRPFTPPNKAVILQPGPLRDVMLTTPLLAALSNAYPRARFDWVVSEAAKAAVSTNSRVTELLPAGFDTLAGASWGALRTLALTLQNEQYDTCIVPNTSPLLAWLAWRAKIPQRIGLHAGGRGFAHTLAAAEPVGETHRAAIYLALAGEMGADTGLSSRLPMTFEPSDRARTAVTQRLIDELNWLGDKPLVVIHPGRDRDQPAGPVSTQWPIERFVLLGNHLVRRHNAQLLLLGGTHDHAFAAAIAGMMVAPAANWAGRTTLGQIGALAEMADLYVGMDAGATHVAAAMACPTLAIFGPTDPDIVAPYSESGRVTILWRGGDERPFSWEHGVTVDEAIRAVDALLQKTR